MSEKDLKGIYLGIFFISVATLLLEISLTRIFSVSQWYHFAFMVVSIAFLGYGASGTFLALKHSLIDRDINRLLIISSSLFSLSCIISFVITQRIPFDPFRITWDHNQIFYIMLYYLVLAVPFFLSGICVGAVFAKIPQKIGKLYFFNLVGSGLGCLLVIVLFSLVGASEVVVFTSLLGALSVLSFSLGERRNTIFATLGVLIFLIFLSGIYPFMEINISPYKALNIALNYKDARLISTEWNAFSRVDVVESGAVRYAPGLSNMFRGRLPPQLGMTIDGNSLQGITGFDGNLSGIEFIDFLPASLPYKLQNKPRVLIIEPGGGLDVLTALYQNSSFIHVVEMNPLIVENIREKHGNFSGGLYKNEKVRIDIDDGRSFVRRSGERYDIIVISLREDIITSSTGIYGLSENYLFTTNAFQDYYEHLSENGILSITRWLQHPPREDIRIVSLSVSALEKEGIENPEQHISAFRSCTTFTILVKKSKFTEQEIQEIRKFCRERNFALVHVPGIKESEVNPSYNQFPEPYYYQLTQGIISNKKHLYQEYLFDISPVNDERPFFFSYFKWDKLAPLYESMGRKWEPFFEGGFLIVMVFIQAIILSVLLILLPLFQRLKKKIVDKFNVLGYFFLLGIGYMLIEIPLIQKFILFLGQPVYAISIVIFSLLLFSGIGSLLSDKFEIKKLKYILITLCILILLYPPLLTFLFHTIISHNLLTRLFISFLMLAPIGVLMGIPFPLGIRISANEGKELIPWAFCTNACASVIASVLAAVIALSLGFSMVLILASVAYLVALGVIWEN